MITGTKEECRIIDKKPVLIIGIVSKSETRNLTFTTTWNAPIWSNNLTCAVLFVGGHESDNECTVVEHRRSMGTSPSTKRRIAIV